MLADFSRRNHWFLLPFFHCFRSGTALLGTHTILDCRCPFPVNLHVQSRKGFTSSWKDTSMACHCAWCGQLKRMDRKFSGLLANRTWEKCPGGASLLLFPPAGFSNRHRMLWIIHLSPKPSLKMDENGAACCLDTSYPPMQRYPAPQDASQWMVSPTSKLSP